MKTSLFKNLSLTSVVLTTALAAVLTACGAQDKNPMEGYDKGVLPENAGKVRDQKRDECGFSFSAPGIFEVVEGGTFKQVISVIGMKTFDGALALQGEPKGMSISGAGDKFTVTYAVPRDAKPEFEFGVLPASQVRKSVQCISKFKGTVAKLNEPKLTIRGVPAALNLDAAAKSNISVNVKVLGLKSNESLSLGVEFDPSLDSTERPICDLSKAMSLAEASLPVNANERMFSIELDPAKMNDIINKKVGAKSKKTEFIFLAVVTGKNKENETSYSKNIIINVTRSLPVAPTPAPATPPAAKPAKAGQK